MSAAHSFSFLEIEPLCCRRLFSFAFLPHDVVHRITQSAYLSLQVGAVTHLKITIYPDGGVMRLRALGFPSPDGNSKL
jgi:allantoicase